MLLCSQSEIFLNEATAGLLLLTNVCPTDGETFGQTVFTCIGQNAFRMSFRIKTANVDEAERFRNH